MATMMTVPKESTTGTHERGERRRRERRPELAHFGRAPDETVERARQVVRSLTAAMR